MYVLKQKSLEFNVTKCLNQLIPEFFGVTLFQHLFWFKGSSTIVVNNPTSGKTEYK